jgi:hypothetical protein
MPPFADAYFATRRLLIGPHRARRTRLYCVGMPKSGTHSIAEMFSRHVRAQHEPEALDLIDKILDRHHGRLPDSEWNAWLRERDRRLALEVDSSHLNLDLLDFLVAEFPTARFLLTIRDCYSWLNSMFNQTLEFRARLDPRWVEMRKLRAGPGAWDYAPEEQVLREHELPSVDSHLARWAARNAAALATVPASRLLVVRTDQITARAFDIADFAGLPRRLVRAQKAHAFRAPVDRQLVRQLDPVFLESKVERHCRPLMTQIFPDVRSLDDVRI